MCKKEEGHLRAVAPNVFPRVNITAAQVDEVDEDEGPVKKKSAVDDNRNPSIGPRAAASQAPSGKGEHASYPGSVLRRALIVFFKRRKTCLIQGFAKTLRWARPCEGVGYL